MKNDARRAILARRAAFLSSALAAMSCSPKQPDVAAGQPTATATVEPVPSSAEPAPTATPTPTPPKPRARKEGEPDVSAPEGTSPEMMKRYATLDDQVEATTSFYDDLESSMPEGCGPTEARCETGWRELAAKVYQERYGMKFHNMWSSACPDASDEVKAFQERVARLRKYRFERRDAFDALLKKTLDAYGKGAPAAFEKMVDDAQKAKPIPCLSPPPCER